jgi:thioredoxin-related protein
MCNFRKFTQMVVIAAFFSAFFLVSARNAWAAELVMLEQKGCIWCERWNAQIGPIYPKTSEGRIAPLRRVDIDKAIPADLRQIRIDRLTPTFILVEKGVEIDRLRGYPGDEFFWFLLDSMLEKLPNNS